MKILKTFQNVLLSLTLLTQSCSATEDGTFAHFYNKYKKKDNFVSFNIPPGLIHLFVSKDEKELKQLLKNIDDIRFLVYESNPDSNKYYATELKNNLSSRLYKDLLQIKNGSDTVEFKIREKNNKVNELIMIVNDSSSFFVMSIEGEIELDKVKELSKSIDVKGIRHLDKASTTTN